MSTSNDETYIILPDKLIISFVDEAMIHNPVLSNYVLFTTEKSLIYTAFFADFGPLNLGLLYKFCQQLHEALSHCGSKRLLYRISNHPHKRTNAAVMVCAYLIFVMNMSVEDAYKPFIGMNDPFYPFRDAGFCINTFPITVLDCCRAMYRAVKLQHFNYRSFNMTNFFHLQKLQNGDISWIVPNKFIAFSGPLTKRRQVAPGTYTLSPDAYVPIFKRLGVSCVVRFNSKCYDRNVFIMNGIRHVDLYYEDGGNPTENILQAFLQLCEQENGAIAVHCKAGLGRTGTNIAAYMMKHYGYTARESIAWCRICRPGSIVGPQQQYLASIEQRMFEEGQEYRKKNSSLQVAETRSLRSSVHRSHLAKNESITNNVSANKNVVATPMLVDGRGNTNSWATHAKTSADGVGLFRRPTPSSARAVSNRRGRSASGSRPANQHANNNDNEIAPGNADDTYTRPATSGGSLIDRDEQSPFHSDGNGRNSGRPGRYDPSNIARPATPTSSARLHQRRSSGTRSSSIDRNSASSKSNGVWKTAENKNSNGSSTEYSRTVANSKTSTIDVGSELTSKPIGAYANSNAEVRSQGTGKVRPSTSNGSTLPSALYSKKSKMDQQPDGTNDGLFTKHRNGGPSVYAQLRQSYRVDSTKENSGLATLGNAVYQHDVRFNGKAPIPIPQPISESQRPKTSAGLQTSYSNSGKYSSAGSRR